MFDDFEWDSEEQQKGVLAYEHWYHEKKLEEKLGAPALRPLDLFFIQKDHESDVYWRDLVGDQVRRLEDQIRLLQLEMKQLREEKCSTSNFASRFFSFLFRPWRKTRNSSKLLLH